MKITPIYQSRFEKFNCCVIIPTYNNARTLERVLNKVLEYTTDILVINDGSTDSTAEILERYSFLQVTHISSNKGKGNALKTGFDAALKLGYEYAISMDSDGQHFPEDLDVFLTALETRDPGDKELLVIGSRKMDDPSVPDKSSIGNRCSSFWFWVETGVRLQDTQCGYRLYPLKAIRDLSLYTNKFELEIEVIVKAAWKGVEVTNLPVQVLYDPEERVSHFRPWQDVARITLLNIWFVGKAFFYIYPRNSFRKFRKKGTKSESQAPFTDGNLPAQ